MRLLKLDRHGEPILAQDYRLDSLPPYAILSHTWYADEQEVTFQDINHGIGRNKAGFEKIRFCGQQARKHGLTYFWVDSCCIDKQNSTELSEAINSMFHWYQRADRCYVFMSDVDDAASQADWERSFRMSKWHRRGWTLQELLAPVNVLFFNNQGRFLGDKASLEGILHDITKIPVEALRGAPLSYFPIDDRLRWARDRQTTRIEDQAYCLFGIFNVFLPLIYGEGSYALVRLKEAIGKHGLKFDQDLLTPNLTEQRDVSMLELSLAITAHRRRERMAALLFERMDARMMNIKDAQPKTCIWVPSHPIYAAWNQTELQDHKNSFMWINGHPGTGKSTVVKYALLQAQEARKDDEIILWFFFNARGDELERSTEGMYRALLHQLLSAAPEHQNVLDDRFTQNFHWTLRTLQDTFASAIGQLKRCNVKCFIDALDEGDEEEIRDMVDYFEDLVDTSIGRAYKLRICFASRHYPTITIQHAQRLILEAEYGHNEDLAKYVDRHLRLGSSRHMQDVRGQILKKANGVFLWVVLVVAILNKEFSRGRIFAVRKRLQEISPVLSNLFKDILRRDRNNLGDLQLCVQWILYAKRPLRGEEFYFAMAAGLEPDSITWMAEQWKENEITADDMARFVLNSSKGLVEITLSEPPTVQFIHESVRDFLLHDGGLAEIMSGESRSLQHRAHERLKICCQHYLSVGFPALESPVVPKLEPWESEKNALHNQVLRQLPFLQYASENVFYHANEAAEEVSQHEFLESFALSAWIHASHTVQLQDSRLYTKQANLLYVLAGYGCVRLISTMRQRGLHHRPFEAWLVSSAERWRYAFLMAFVNGHREAMLAIQPGFSTAIYDLLPYDRDFSPISEPPRALLEGESPLEWAKSTRNPVLAATILESSPEAGTSEWPTLCMLAIECGDSELMEYCLSKGVNPNSVSQVDDQDRSLLAHAICLNCHECVRVLVAKGACVNVKWGESLQTPLMEAAQAGNFTIVELLIDGGADIHAVNAQGLSAIALAIRKKRSRVYYILHGKGAVVDAPSHISGRAIGDDGLENINLVDGVLSR